jgi:hypothetical protein
MQRADIWVMACCLCVFSAQANEENRGSVVPATHYCVSIVRSNNVAMFETAISAARR